MEWCFVMAERKERAFGMGNIENTCLFYYAGTMQAYEFRRFALLVASRFCLAILVMLASPGGAQALTICIDEPAPGVVLHPRQSVSVEWHSPDYPDDPEQQPQVLFLQWEDVRTGEIIAPVNVTGDSLPMGSHTLEVPTQINDRDEIRLTAEYGESLWDPSSVIPPQAERVLRVYRQSEHALWLIHPNPLVTPADSEDACANPLAVRPGGMRIYWGMSGCDPDSTQNYLNISYSIDRELWEHIKRVDNPCSVQSTTWTVPNRLSDDVRLKLEWWEGVLDPGGGSAPPGHTGPYPNYLADVVMGVPFSIHSETNSPPIARIVPETQSVLSQETVHLDGCESTDADGDDIDHKWNRGSDSHNIDIPVILNNHLDCRASFRAPPVNVTQGSAVLSFNLRVTDEQNPEATLRTQQAVTLITVLPNPDDPDGDEINSSSGDNCPDVANLDQNNSDGDGFGDACDNCLSIPNNQDDSDGDGRGDLCEDCPFDAQNDIDRDEICGDVDLCPTVWDDGTDFDNDGEGDACDCDDHLRGPREVGADCGGICPASCEDEGECRSLFKSGLPESKFDLVLLIGDDYVSTYPTYADVYGEATRDVINMFQQTYLADPIMGSPVHRDKYNLWYIRKSDYIVELDAKAECVASASNAGADCTDNSNVCRDGTGFRDPTLCSTAVCDASASNAGTDCAGNSNVCLDSTGASDRTLCAANLCYWEDVGWKNICGHGELAVILHNQVCRDKSIGEEFSSEPTSIGTLLHETGHALFGLGDEYDDRPGCITHYHSTVPIENSNIWDSEALCRAHTSLPNPNDCDPTNSDIPFTPCGSDWWKAQAGRHMMECNCRGYPASICAWGNDAARQVNFILNTYSTPKMPEQALLGYFHFDGEVVTLRGFKPLTSRWPDRKVRRSSGLLFELRNLAGEMLADFTIRDPRYIHYLDPPLGGQLLDKTDFSVVLPYRDDASELVIRDIETKRVLGRFDLTRVLPPVCLDNPDEPACSCAGDLDKDRDVDRDDLTLFARGYANCSPSIDLSSDGKVSPPDLKLFAEDLGKIHCPDDEIDKCDDGNRCTRDYFDPITQVCVNEPKYCFDGLRCTIDSCDPQTGSCLFTPRDCNDGRRCTIDSCDPLTGKCQHDRQDCDDGNACTTETCDPKTGKCIFHEINCADKNFCTVDQCDSTVGCFHINLCDDNNPCTIDTCDAKLGTCSHKPDPKCQVVPHHYLEKKAD